MLGDKERGRMHEVSFVCFLVENLERKRKKKKGRKRKERKKERKKRKGEGETMRGRGKDSSHEREEDESRAPPCAAIPRSHCCRAPPVADVYFSPVSLLN